MAAADDIGRAVEVLRRGGLVAFPTETVYGLGADAENPDAVRRIFAAKGRPADHPVIVHLADAGALGAWADPVPAAAERLAAAFWPGPLTLIVPRARRVPDVVTGGQATVGLRVPDHPVAEALLRAFGGGLAAPSANRFGRISPTRAEHVRAELGDSVEVILEGGQSRVGLESTIVDVSGEHPAILRPGGISAAEVGRVLGVEVPVLAKSAVRAPGMLESHYAPRTPMRLVAARRLLPDAAGALDRVARVAVLARTETLPQGYAQQHGPRILWRMASATDAAGYGHDLYATLRDLDDLGVDEILVEAPPENDPAWLAVRDRLQRAAHG